MAPQKLRPSFTFTEDRLRELQQVVPEAFADGKINWDVLREALGEYLEDAEACEEHFGLFWPGKREARRLAALPSKGTLAPAPGEGVNEETTRNLFIEGENLEVLKLLQKSYAGRVKMIYIDPPYNTGKDFIYPDDYREPLEAYLKRTGQMDAEGRRLTTNTKASGRFHANWLNMMYPRLLLARQLLREDGVIFVSIDDNEVHNLRQVMNEVFGEENFIAQFVWNTEGHTDNQFQVKVNHEYIVLYSKNVTYVSLGYIIDPNTRKESNLWRGFAENSITKNGPANPFSVVELPAGFPCAAEDLDLPPTKVDTRFFSEIQSLGFISREVTNKFNVTYPVRLDRMVAENGQLSKPCKVLSGWANVNKLRLFIKNNCTPIETDDGGTMTFYLSKKGVIYYKKTRGKARNILSVLRNMGTTERMRSELESMGIPFQYPKPMELLAYLLNVGLDEPGIVLDFFAGSCTTAHSVLEQIHKNRVNCQFVMVQLPESLDPDKKEQRSAVKFCDGIGKPRNIAEIGKERIRRAIAKIQAEAAPPPEGQLSLVTETDESSTVHRPSSAVDLGFKVLKLQRSHFKDWQPVEPTDPAQLDDLFSRHASPLVEGWQPQALLTEILLLEGFPLDSQVIPLEDGFPENAVWRVHHPDLSHELFVCLDEKVEPSTVERLPSALRTEDIFICLDAALTDEAKVVLDDRLRLKVI